jgi:hypothetical protein
MRSASIASMIRSREALAVALFLRLYDTVCEPFDAKVDPRNFDPIVARAVLSQVV